MQPKYPIPPSLYPIWDEYTRLHHLHRVDRLKTPSWTDFHNWRLHPAHSVPSTHPQQPGGSVTRRDALAEAVWGIDHVRRRVVECTMEVEGKKETKRLLTLNKDTFPDVVAVVYDKAKYDDVPKVSDHLATYRRSVRNIDARRCARRRFHLHDIPTLIQRFPGAFIFQIPGYHITLDRKFNRAAAHLTIGTSSTKRVPQDTANLNFTLPHSDPFNPPPRPGAGLDTSRLPSNFVITHVHTLDLAATTDDIEHLGGNPTTAPPNPNNPGANQVNQFIANQVFAWNPFNVLQLPIDLDAITSTALLPDGAQFHNIKLSLPISLDQALDWLMDHGKTLGPLTTTFRLRGTGWTVSNLTRMAMLMPNLCEIYLGAFELDGRPSSKPGIGFNPPHAYVDWGSLWGFLSLFPFPRLDRLTIAIEGHLFAYPPSPPISPPKRGLTWLELILWVPIGDGLWPPDQTVDQALIQALARKLFNIGGEKCFYKVSFPCIGKQKGDWKNWGKTVEQAGREYTRLVCIEIKEIVRQLRRG